MSGLILEEPSPNAAQIKLNLGCGRDIRPGYINIDAFVRGPGITTADVRNLSALIVPASVDAILAQDILEHIPFREVPGVLRHWANLMTIGATIRIRVPDIVKQAE